MQTQNDLREYADVLKSEPRSDEFATVVEPLRDVGRSFHGRGWSVGTSSNYSMTLTHEPLELLITASGKDKGRLTSNDFVIVGANGAPVLDKQPKSSAETLLHVEIVRHTGAGSVLHTHSIWGTLISDLFFAEGGIAIEGYEMLKGLEGISTHETCKWIEIFENSQDISELSRQVGERLADLKRPLEHGFLIRNHGLYTWGPSLEVARRHVEILEFLFEVVGRKIELASTVPAHVLQL